VHDLERRLIQRRAAGERLDACELSVEFAPRARVGAQQASPVEAGARWPPEIQQRTLVAGLGPQQGLPKELSRAGADPLGVAVGHRWRVVDVDGGDRELGVRRLDTLARQ